MKTIRKHKIGYAIVLSIVFLIIISFKTAIAATPVNGSLKQYGNIQVLNVWGTNYEMGYAHGYLLAGKIRDLIEHYMIGLIADGSVSVYNSLLSKIDNKTFIWRQQSLDEMNGIAAGMADSGVDLWVDSLGRDINVIDIKAFNLQEEFFFGCSTFGVWGSATANGETILGRNFDFYYDDQGDMIKYQLIIAFEPTGKSKFISFAWPGMIGVFTGMNENGVAVLVDTGNDYTSAKSPYHPIAEVYRQILEETTPGNYLTRPLSIVNSVSEYTSEIIQIGIPSTDADDPVYYLEDATNSNVIRYPWDTDPNHDNIIATNHFIKAIPPPSSGDSVNRYNTVKNDLLNLYGSGDRTVDSGEAWDVLASVADIVAPTLTTMVFRPDRMEFDLSFATLSTRGRFTSAVDVPPQTFTFNSLFANDAPDLVVQSIDSDKTGVLENQPLEITVSVKNQGDADAGGYSIDLYKNLTGAPGPSQIGDESCTKAGLAAGQTDSCTFSISFDTPGSYSVWAQADTGDAVAESDESNNYSGPYQITVVAEPVNQPPAAEDDSYSTTVDTALAVSSPGVLGNDTDADGDSLTAFLVGTPSHGNVVLNADGSFTYTPANGFSGTDDFTYLSNDGAADSNTATVSISVRSLNSAPSAADDNYSTDENSVLTVPAPGVLGNDTDADGDSLTAVQVGAPSHGNVVLNANGSFTYTPAGGYSGTDSFTYRSNDGAAASNTATVSITVIAVNTSPLAVDDVDETSINIPVTTDVIANDSDGDNDSLTVFSVTQPQNGTVLDNGDGTITYTPDQGFTGQDSYTYTVSDGNGAYDTATVTLTVHGALPDIVVFTDSFESGLGKWTQDVQRDWFRSSQRAVSGRYSAEVDGSANDSQLISMPVDLQGRSSVTITFSWYIERSLDTGEYLAFDVSSDNGKTWVEERRLRGNVDQEEVWHQETVEVSNIDSLMLRFRGRMSDFREDADVDDVEVTASGEAAPVEGPAILQSGVSQQAVVASDEWVYYQITTSAADTQLQIELTNLSADLDLYVQKDSIPTLSSYVYRPYEDSTTQEIVSIPDPGAATWYIGINGYEAGSGTITATIENNTAPVNQPPAAAGDNYGTNENSILTVPAPGVLGNDTDADGDSLTAVLVGAPSNGDVVLNADGSFTYTPDNGYSGTDSFTYMANDGKADGNTATVSISITRANSAPSAADDSYSTNENSVLAVPSPGVLENDTDADGDSLTAFLVGTPSHGNVVLNTNGSFTYTPANGFSGTDTFTYMSNDGAAASNTATVSITVIAVNTPPLAVDDVDETLINTPVTTDVIANDSDEDNDPLTVFSVTQPQNGTVLDNGDGTITYTPNQGFTGQDTYTYTVSDGNGAYGTATVTLTVHDALPDIVVFTDSFESGLGKWTQDSQQDWFRSSQRAVTGNYSAEVDGSASDAQLVSGAIDLQGRSSVTITFSWYIERSLDTGEYLAFDISADNGNTWVEKRTLQGNVDQEEVWHQETVEVSNIDSLMLRFRGRMSDSREDADVDDVEVTANGDAAPVQNPVILQSGVGQQAVVASDGWVYYQITTSAADTQLQVELTNLSADLDLYVQEDSMPNLSSYDYRPYEQYTTSEVVSIPDPGAATWYIGVHGFEPGSGTVTATIENGTGPVNQPPAAADDSYSTTVDTALTVPSPGVLGNDTDADGDSLTAVLVDAPSNGDVVLNADGSFTYTPASGFSGTDSFTYMSNDGAADSNTATVSISISSGTGTVLFSDDFTDPTLSPWTNIAGQWQVSNGVLQGSSVAWEYATLYTDNGGASWGDYSVEARVRLPAGSYGGGIGGRVDTATGRRYGAWIYPNGSYSGSNVLKLVKFYDWSTWSFTPMAEVSLPDVGTDWHTIRMTFTGNRIQVYYDGVAMIDVTDNNYESFPTYLSGGVTTELWTYDNTYLMDFDSITVFQDQ